MELRITKSESGLSKRQKYKKCIFTLGKEILDGGTLQEITNVLQVLHAEIKTVQALSVNLTLLPLNRNFSDSKQELRISRNVTGSLLEWKL